MKRITAILLLAFPASSLAAENHYYKFGGVDNYHDSMLIDDADSPRAKNVITDEGDLRTIPGNVLYSLVGTSSITFLGEFIDLTGKQNLISKSGVNIYSGVTLIQVQAADRHIDMTTAFNTAFFVDGSSTGNFWYDGTSTGTSTGFEDCAYTEYYENRLACVRTTTDTAKVKFTAYNSSTSWSVTASKDSGTIKYFNRDDGYGITCVKSTPFGLFLGKGRSTQFIKGSDNEMFHQVSLSVDVGCVDDRTVQLVDGELVWLSRDGYYGYDGTTLRPISLEVRGTTKNIRQSASADSSWTTNTQSAWQSGIGTGWDYTILPGSIKTVVYTSGSTTTHTAALVQLSTNAGFNDGTFGGWTLTNWDSLQVTSNEGPEKETPNEARFFIGRRIGAYWAFEPNCISYECKALVSILKADDNAVVTSAVLIPGGTKNGDMKCVDKTFSEIPSAYPVKIAYHWGGVSTATSMGFISSTGLVSVRLCYAFTTSDMYFDVYDSSFAYLSYLSNSFDSGLSTVTAYAKDVKGTSVTVTLAYSADNITFSTSVVPNRYVKYQVQFTSGVTVSSFTSVTLSVISTSVYKSAVKFLATDISTWKQFTVADTETGVTPLFYVRTATYAFTVETSSPEWVSQTKNAVVAASTNPYVQFQIDPNITTSTQSVIVNSVNIEYGVGSVAPRSASVVADQRYIVAVSTSSATQNDLVMIWQKNKEWVPCEDVSYGALTLFNGKPIAGDGTATGKIWTIMQDTAYSFDGLAIDSFWITKDFTWGVPNHKVMNRFWIQAEEGGVQNLNVSWMKDRTAPWVSTSTALSGASFVVREVEHMFDTKTAGRQFRFKIGAAELDKYFRLKGYSIYYDVNPLIK